MARQRFFLPMSLSCAVACAVLPTSVQAAPIQQTRPVDYRTVLGPGCSWSQWSHKNFIQRCTVYSPSMKRSMPVDIKRGKRRNAPVVFMLDGARASNTVSDWLRLGKIQGDVKDRDVTFVFPAGGAGSFYADWDKQGGAPYKYSWETFVTRELPAFLTRTFGVIPGDWSVAGISMGAHSAIRLTAQHPDLFSTVFGFSGIYNIGYYGANTMIKEVLPNTTAHDMYGPKSDPRWGPFNIGSKTGAQQLVHHPHLRRIVLTSAQSTPDSDDYMGVYLEELARDDSEATAKLYKQLKLPVTYYQSGVGIHSWNMFTHGFHIGFVKNDNQLPSTRVKPLPKKKAPVKKAEQKPTHKGTSVQKHSQQKSHKSNAATSSGGHNSSRTQASPAKTRPAPTNSRQGNQLATNKTT